MGILIKKSKLASYRSGTWSWSAFLPEVRENNVVWASLALQRCCQCKYDRDWHNLGHFFFFFSRFRPTIWKFKISFGPVSKVSWLIFPFTFNTQLSRFLSLILHYYLHYPFVQAAFNHESPDILASLRCQARFYWIFWDPVQLTILFSLQCYGCVWQCLDS